MNATAGLPDLHGYHAHIYYHRGTRSIAEKLVEGIAEKFSVERGRFGDDPIGPHPVSQTSVTFTPESFAGIVSWLMFNRQGLDILVHPLGDDQYEDHTSNALWLGRPIDLKLDVLPHAGYPADLLPSPEFLASQNA